MNHYPPMGEQPPGSNGGDPPQAPPPQLGEFPLVQQPLPPRQKKQLSLGAWIGIIAGGLMLVLFIAYLAIYLTAVAGGSNQGTDPSPTPKPTPQEPQEDESSRGVVYFLNDTTTFTNGPFWVISVQDGWEALMFNRDGYHHFSHPSSGCELMSYQGYGVDGVVAEDDRSATEETIEAVLRSGLPWDKAIEEPVVDPAGTVVLPGDGYDRVELQRLVTNYQTVDGERKREIYLRTFMPANNLLFVEVDCPATADGEAAETPMLENIRVTEY